MMKINTATTLSKQTTSKPAMITGATSSTTTNGTTTTHTSEDLTITTNKIPLPLLAYVILGVAYEPTPDSMFIFCCCFLPTCACPIIRALQFGGDYAFGGDSLSNTMYVLRLLWFQMAMVMVFFFASFPYLDAYKRWLLSQVLLVLFLDDPEARNYLRTRNPKIAERISLLNPNGTDLLAGNVNNLQAVWVLCKTASPTLLRNMMCQYNCGYSLASLVYVSLCTALLVFMLTDDETHVYWPFVVEQACIFLGLGGIIVYTVFYGVWCNQSLQKLEHIFLRGNIRSAHRVSASSSSCGSSSTKGSRINSGMMNREHLHTGPPLSEKEQRKADQEAEQQQLLLAKHEFFQTTAADFATELRLHFNCHSMQFLYRPATSELVNFVYAYVSFLVSAILSAFVAGGHFSLTPNSG